MHVIVCTRTTRTSRFVCNIGLRPGSTLYLLPVNISPVHNVQLQCTSRALVLAVYRQTWYPSTWY
jgi:hypothetical protein